MKHIRLKAIAVLTAGALASGALLAQTSSSSSSPGVNPSSPSSSSPGSGAPNPGSMRNEPTVPAPGGATPSPSVTTPPSPPPSTPSDTTMGRSATDALATPEDRAKCASLSGTAQADCVSDARRQREAGDRVRSSNDTGGANRGRM